MHADNLWQSEVEQDQYPVVGLEVAVDGLGGVEYPASDFLGTGQLVLRVAVRVECTSVDSCMKSFSSVTISLGRDPEGEVGASQCLSER